MIYRPAHGPRPWPVLGCLVTFVLIFNFADRIGWFCRARNDRESMNSLLAVVKQVTKQNDFDGASCISVVGGGFCWRPFVVVISRLQHTVATRVDSTPVRT